MENDQNKENLDPKDQARNLYFNTNLTQAQIAELIGVSQKTISLWMNDGKWKSLRNTALRAPVVLIEHMAQELSELHRGIASREPGKRYATLHEAEIRRKIMMSMKYIREQQSKGAHAEVMINFMEFVQRRNMADAKTIILHADAYMQGVVQLDQDTFEPYRLPGDPEMPVKEDKPADDDKPDSLNKAA
jgi:transcriptional regulator with XRE-family HTH domain